MRRFYLSLKFKILKNKVNISKRKSLSMMQRELIESMELCLIINKKVSNIHFSNNNISKSI